MANTVKYGMGQIRYVDSSSYMTDKNFSFETIKTLIASSSDVLDEQNSEF